MSGPKRHVIEPGDYITIVDQIGRTIDVGRVIACEIEHVENPTLSRSWHGYPSLEAAPEEYRITIKTQGR